MSHKYMAGFSWSEKRSGACRHGNENGARVLAKSLVRLRGQRTKVMASSAQLRGVRASIGVSDCASTSPPNIVQDTHLQRGITRAKQIQYISANAVQPCERAALPMCTLRDRCMMHLYRRELQCHQTAAATALHERGRQCP